LTTKVALAAVVLALDAGDQEAATRLAQRLLATDA
jgi:hypothetical protein